STAGPRSPSRRAADCTPSSRGSPTRRCRSGRARSRAKRRFVSARATRRRGDAGQALVELALVAPLLLVLAFGVVGVGRVAQGQLGVSAVAREAARAAALADTPADARARGLARGHDVAARYRLDNASPRLAGDPG